MEGGSDFDLKALDIPDPPPDTGKRSRQNSESQHERRDSDRREGDRREGERRDSERRDSERSNSERSKREREDRPDRRLVYWRNCCKTLLYLSSPAHPSYY